MLLLLRVVRWLKVICHQHHSRSWYCLHVRKLGLVVGRLDNWYQRGTWSSSCGHNLESWRRHRERLSVGPFRLFGSRKLIVCSHCILHVNLCVLRHTERTVHEVSELCRCFVRFVQHFRFSSLTISLQRWFPVGWTPLSTRVGLCCHSFVDWLSRRVYSRCK